MKPSRLPLLTLVSALCLSGAATGIADALGVDHSKPPQAVVVEHAEILLPSAEGERAEGYLAIWNGTQTQANLISIASDVFESSRIYRTVSGNIEAVPGGVFIPGHAELKMRSGGVHLVLKRPRVPFGQIEHIALTLGFQDGTRLSVPMRIVKSKDELTDHRHGEGDRIRQ